MITFAEMKLVISELESHKYDALILKTRKENHYPTKEYTEINNLLVEIGYNITNNASCVIPISFFKKECYKRYMGTTFLHMGIFVENLCLQEEFRVKYLSGVMVKNVEIPNQIGTGWMSHPFLNFGKLWFEFIMSLPCQVTMETKRFVLKEHNRITNLFSIRSVIGQMGGKNRQRYKEAYLEARFCVNYIERRPRWIYDFLILYIPTFLYVWAHKVKDCVCQLDKYAVIVLGNKLGSLYKLISI